MDNLNNKIIKQFYYNMDYGTTIVTVVIDNKTKYAEFYAHVAGMGVINFVYGVHVVNNIEGYALQALDIIDDSLLEQVQDGFVADDIDNSMKEFKIYSDEIARKAREGI